MTALTDAQLAALKVLAEAPTRYGAKVSDRTDAEGLGGPFIAYQAADALIALGLARTARAVLHLPTQVVATDAGRERFALAPAQRHEPEDNCDGAARFGPCIECDEMLCACEQAYGHDCEGVTL